MRKTLTTAALVLALSCPAWAGIMHIPPAPEPQPASAAPELQATTENETQNTFQGTVAQTVLELLAVLPSIL